MRMSEHVHESFIDLIANTLVRSATNHGVSAIMQGHGVVAIIGISCAVIIAAWLIKRAF